MSLRFNFQINFDVTFAFTSNSLRLNFRVHFDCTFDFMFDVTSIAILNSRSTPFRCHFRIHFDVTFEVTSRSLRFHTHLRFNVKDKIFPGYKRYDLPREKIKDTTPTAHFPPELTWQTPRARTHDRTETISLFQGGAGSHYLPPTSDPWTPTFFENDASPWMLDVNHKSPWTADVHW